MLQVPRRAGLRGPTLVRLLARLADLDVGQSDKSLSVQLSQWLGWADAIALSSALKAAPTVPSASDSAAANQPEAEECARVRAALATSIIDDSVFAPRRRGPARPSLQAEAIDAQVDFGVYRQRYVFVQQNMETAIGHLRARLRAALSARAPDIARLAMIDAVMERVLGAREQALMSAVPTLLAAHFERLRQAEAAALAEARQSAPTTTASTTAAAATTAPTTAAAARPARAIVPGTWLRTFRTDMQSVLRAELDIRFQPVDGLLAALRDS